jgi:hypothetical protein
MLERVLALEEGLANLVNKEWIQFVAWDPDSDALAVYEDGKFHPYAVENPAIAVVDRSADYYSRRRGHLSPAHVKAGLLERGVA